MKRNKIWIIIVKNLLQEKNIVWKLRLAATFWENSIPLIAFLSLICYNFMCLFPILLRWQMTQLSSGCTNTSEYKEAIQRPLKPHTHAAKRAPFTIEQPGVVTHSNVCPCTAVKHSRGNSEALEDSLKKKAELREWNKNLGHSTSVSLLLLIHRDLCYIGAVPTTYDNILVSASSEEHRGPHTMCKMILVAEVCLSRKIWQTVKIPQK